MEPVVSIVIPCYNDETRVADAIESALGQTYDATEIIVVNDGSTDDSAAAILEYENQITYLGTKNHGACHARNEGLNRASGTYVKFLDADDTLYREAVEHQVAQSRALGESDQIVYGDARYVRPDGVVLRETDFPANPETENRILYVLSRNIQTSLPLHRRSLLDTVDGFDETLPRAQEYDLHFRLAACGVQFVYRPTWVVRVLRHDDPDRIGNQDHFSDQPRGRLERIQERAAVAYDCDLLDEALKKHLARASWHSGRMAIRADFPEIAGEYFELARSLHTNHIASTSKAYRWATELMGPLLAERLIEKVRSAKNMM